MLQGSPSTALTTINAMNQGAFVALLGGVFEHSPWVAERAWDARPFASVGSLHEAMMAIVVDADDGRKRALLRAHPELSGREADAGALTKASTDEQARAGLDALSPEEYARMTQLNADYQSKFGFPFIIAVRHHTKASIFGEFERRLANDRADEIANNLNQIAAITRLRLDDIVADDRRTADAVTNSMASD